MKFPTELLIIPHVQVIGKNKQENEPEETWVIVSIFSKKYPIFKLHYYHTK